MLQFHKEDLPFNNKMKSFWEDSGYLVIEDFYAKEDCDNLRKRAQYLTSNFDQKSYQSIFDTNKEYHANDNYFLESGDKIRFFFEDKAFDENGNLTNDKELVINKIGHALHDLDDEFFNFSHSTVLDHIAKSLGMLCPLILQSMYIFKQPRIGGEVVCHPFSPHPFNTSIGYLLIGLSS